MTALAAPATILPPRPALPVTAPTVPTVALAPAAPNPVRVAFVAAAPIAPAAAFVATTPVAPAIALPATIAGGINAKRGSALGPVPFFILYAILFTLIFIH